MSRLWVSVVVVLLVVDALGIFLGGLASGAWSWGLIFAAMTMAVLVDWLRLRSSAETPRAVADRMIAGVLALLLGLAIPAARHIEAWLAAR